MVATLLACVAPFHPPKVTGKTGAGGWQRFWSATTRPPALKCSRKAEIGMSGRPVNSCPRPDGVDTKLPRSWRASGPWRSTPRRGKPPLGGGVTTTTRPLRAAGRFGEVADALPTIDFAGQAEESDRNCAAEHGWASETELGAR